MYQNPKRAKRLYFDTIPKNVDEYSRFLSSAKNQDIELLISQSKRCSEILKRISKKQIEEDKFFSSTKLEDLLEEIINSFKETSSKEINLVSDNDNNKILDAMAGLWCVNIGYGRVT